MSPKRILVLKLIFMALKITSRIIIISWILIISKLLQAEPGLNQTLWVHSPTCYQLAREHLIYEPFLFAMSESSSMNVSFFLSTWVDEAWLFTAPISSHFPYSAALNPFSMKGFFMPLQSWFQSVLSNESQWLLEDYLLDYDLTCLFYIKGFHLFIRLEV